MQLFYYLGVSSPFDSQHRLVTSPFVSPFVLASIRLTLALYTLFTALFILVWDAVREDTAQKYFSYFTELSFIGLCAYFFAAGVQTLFYAWRGGKGYPLQSWPRVMQFLHLLLHSTIITFPLLVTIVYWALLASPTVFENRFSAWSNISHHILNTIFALFEILLTNTGPSPWLHLPFCIILLGFYLGVAYITHKTQGFYAYNFLDPSKQHALLAAYIVGIAVAQCIIFAIVRGIVILRERLLIRRRLAEEPSYPPEEIDDWHEIERPLTPIAI